MKTHRDRACLKLGDVGLALAVALACFPLRNNDLWWHLAAGRFMREQAQFIRGDPFSYTGYMGSWTNNEWLAQVVFFATWSMGGVFALIALRAATYGTLFLLLRGYLRAARAPSVFLPALVAGMAVSYPWWELRPSLLSLLCLIGLLFILERFRRSGGGLWLLPPLFLVWANLYPGFLFGLVVLIATLAAWGIEPALSGWRRWAFATARRSSLLFATVASAAVTLANPYGRDVYRQQLDVLRNAGFRAALDEYAPPSPVFFCLVTGCCAFFVWHRFRKTPLPSLVPILGAAVLSLSAVKFQEYFAVVGLTAMMAHLGRPRPRGLPLCFLLAVVVAGLALSVLDPLPTVIPEGSGSGSDADPSMHVLHHRMLVCAGLLGGLLLASLAAVASRRGDARAAQRMWRSVLPTPHAAIAVLAVATVTTGFGFYSAAVPRDGVEPARYPTRCLSALPRNGERRVFNRLSWGGWLLWHSRLPTFIDGRGWGQPLFFEYIRIGGPDGPTILEERGIDWAIVAPRDALAARLAAGPDWKAVCTDDASVVFRRFPQGER